MIRSSLVAGSEGVGSGAVVAVGEEAGATVGSISSTSSGAGATSGRPSAIAGGASAGAVVLVGSPQAAARAKIAASDAKTASVGTLDLAKENLLRCAGSAITGTTYSEKRGSTIAPTDSGLYRLRFRTAVSCFIGDGAYEAEPGRIMSRAARRLIALTTPRTA